MYISKNCAANLILKKSTEQIAADFFRDLYNPGSPRSYHEKALEARLKRFERLKAQHEQETRDRIRQQRNQQLAAYRQETAAKIQQKREEQMQAIVLYEESQSAEKQMDHARKIQRQTYNRYDFGQAKNIPSGDAQKELPKIKYVKKIPPGQSAEEIIYQNLDQRVGQLSAALDKRANAFMDRITGQEGSKERNYRYSKDPASQGVYIPPSSKPNSKPGSTAASRKASKDGDRTPQNPHAEGHYQGGYYQGQNSTQSIDLDGVPGSYAARHQQNSLSQQMTPGSMSSLSQSAQRVSGASNPGLNPHQRHSERTSGGHSLHSSYQPGQNQQGHGGSLEASSHLRLSQNSQTSQSGQRTKQEQISDLKNVYGVSGGGGQKKSAGNVKMPPIEMQRAVQKGSTSGSQGWQ